MKSLKSKKQKSTNKKVPPYKISRSYKSTNEFMHYYNIKKYGKDYFKMPCKILRGFKNGNIEIELKNRRKIITTRFGVRKI